MTLAYACRMTHRTPLNRSLASILNSERPWTLNASKVALLVAVVLAVAGLSIAHAPIAAAEPNKVITGLSEPEVRAALQTGKNYAVAGDDEVFVRASDLRIRALPAVERQSASAASAPWAACGLFDNKTKLVKNYGRQKIAGYSGTTAHLKCGTAENWGLRHIKRDHLYDWQAKADYIGEGFTQFADWSFTQTLSHPSRKYHRPSNDTLQYETPIQIKNSKGQVINTFTSHVSVARKSQNIITAYPAS